LRGGGIHRRLQQLEHLQLQQQQHHFPAETKEMRTGIYPQMDKLYNLRKRLRRLVHKVDRDGTGTGTGTPPTKEQDEIRVAIADLSVSLLPIAGLRNRAACPLRCLSG